ncbi:hypothetical protein ACFV1L_06220 [Kitasatospora sp. NPDC059646]|uniref:hypothetical protein n=1 Tax=Kitasatospora sp. NPDC059646 TaxID=3346893 RepID=UPI0036CDAAFB
MADRIRVTVVYEYKPNMKYYHGCNDVHEAAQLDAEICNIREFPEDYGSDEIVSVNYEGIPG